MGNLVAKTATPLTDEEAVQGIADAYELVTGEPATPGVHALLTAQSDFESGGWKSKGGSGFFNYNPGGVKRQGDGDYFESQTTESPDGGVTTEHVTQQFAAFDSAAKGFEAWIRQIQRRPAWWQGLHTETVDGYVDGLTTPPLKYFTGSPDDYKAGLKARLERLRPLLVARLAESSAQQQGPAAGEESC